MKSSQIEWTNMTWNPVTGCNKVSAGCKNCYALAMSKRLQAMGSPRYQNGFEVTLQDDLIDLPFRWRKPRLVFVNSMSDLFHEKVPFEFIERVFRTMVGCPQHQFQILTKRPERLVELADRLPWPGNVWMGVSIETERYADRSRLLALTPAKVKFLSMEPLLGPVPEVPLEGIHWVIVGGESGPKARPMEEIWVDGILSHCRDNNVAFFFKQWGGVQKHRSGRELHGRTYSEFPEVGQANHNQLALISSSPSAGITPSVQLIDD